MRKAVLTFLSVAILSITAGSTPALAQSDEPGTIVEVAAGNPDFSTLVTAVKAADLAETLSGKGPFTVFAPTNDAFEKLPAGTLDTLLEDPDGALADILKLHVIGGAVDSKAAIAAAGGNVDALGGPISVALDGDNLVVGGATVVTADLKASNGIIHVIDTVITKPATSAPTQVDTGDDGFGATSGINSMLLMLASALAIFGIGTSSVALNRNRRKN
jgi:uncharacterized surface protein with fasciclin (FAS1) repeats